MTRWLFDPSARQRAATEWGAILLGAAIFLVVLTLKIAGKL